MAAKVQPVAVFLNPLPMRGPGGGQEATAATLTNSFSCRLSCVLLISRPTAQSDTRTVSTDTVSQTA